MPAPASPSVLLLSLSLLAVTAIVVAAVAVVHDPNDDDDNAILRRQRMRSERESERDSDNDTKPSKRHHSYYRCCNDGSERDSLYEGYRDLKRLCLREYRENPSPPVALYGRSSWDGYNREERQQEYICVSQCVARHINIVDNNGTLIPAAVHSNTHSLAQATWQHMASDNISDTCLTQVAAAPTNLTRSGCNPAALQLSYCVWREFTLRCPAEFQSHTRRCDTLRARLNSGENLEIEAYLSYRTLAKPTADVHDEPVDLLALGSVNGPDE